jgi:hypothetical protein
MTFSARDRESAGQDSTGFADRVISGSFKKCQMIVVMKIEIRRKQED